MEVRNQGRKQGLSERKKQQGRDGVEALVKER